jgi:hypothetical protein
MSLLLGDTGKAQVSPLKTFTITPGAARETLLGTPLILPTTEPATAQVSFTVQSSDLPTITGNVPMKYNAVLYVSGKIGVAASVVNYRVLKNSVSVAQAAGVSATAAQYWTHTHWRTFDVQVGDVLEVKYWAVQADVNLDFYGLIIFPSQPIPYKQGAILKDLDFSTVINTPNFSTATTIAFTGSYYLFPFANSATSIGVSAAANFPAVIPNSTYGLFRNQYPEITVQTNQSVHATQRQIQKVWYPSTISFREVLR